MGRGITSLLSFNTTAIFPSSLVTARSLRQVTTNHENITDFLHMNKQCSAI